MSRNRVHGCRDFTANLWSDLRRCAVPFLAVYAKLLFMTRFPCLAVPSPCRPWNMMSKVGEDPQQLWLRVNHIHSVLQPYQPQRTSVSCSSLDLPLYLFRNGREANFRNVYLQPKILKDKETGSVPTLHRPSIALMVPPFQTHLDQL